MQPVAFPGGYVQFRFVRGQVVPCVIHHVGQPFGFGPQLQRGVDVFRLVGVGFLRRVVARPCHLGDVQDVVPVAEQVGEVEAVP